MTDLQIELYRLERVFKSALQGYFQTSDVAQADRFIGHAVHTLKKKLELMKLGELGVK